MENKEEIPKKRPSMQKRRRSSFFGLITNEIERVNEEKNEHLVEMKKQMEKLEQEFQDWPHQYIIAKKKLEDFWRNNCNSEVTLTPAQQNYLKNAINMQQYEAIYNEYYNTLKLYTLKKDWMHERLIYCLEQVKEKVIESELQKKLHLRFSK